MQAIGVPMHEPLAHRSATVQRLPSLQARVFGVNTQPRAGSQESSVQRLLSLQVMGAVTHAPLAHASVVQALESLQVVSVAV